MPYKDPEARRANLRKNAAIRKKALIDADPIALEKQKKRKEYEQRYYVKNQEQITKDHAKWRAEHPGYFTEQNHKNGRYKPWEEYKSELDVKRKSHSEYMVKWNASEKGQRARTERELKKKFEIYGLTIDQYEDKWLEQDGKCAMCKKECPVYGQYRIHIDHDHATGKVRDLLCGNCNSGLGQLRESEELLQTAIDYIRKHGA
jgi:predicted transcriptional regulator